MLFSCSLKGTVVKKPPQCPKVKSGQAGFCFGKRTTVNVGTHCCDCEWTALVVGSRSVSWYIFQKVVVNIAGTGSEERKGLGLRCVISFESQTLCFPSLEFTQPRVNTLFKSKNAFCAEAEGE